MMHEFLRLQVPLGDLLPPSQDESPGEADRDPLQCFCFDGCHDVTCERCKPNRRTMSELWHELSA